MKDISAVEIEEEKGKFPAALTKFIESPYIYLIRRTIRCRTRVPATAHVKDLSAVEIEEEKVKFPAALTKFIESTYI